MDQSNDSVRRYFLFKLINFQKMNYFQQLFCYARSLQQVSVTLQEGACVSNIPEKMKFSTSPPPQNWRSGFCLVFLQ
jgi:hypothetical protein